MLSGPGHSGLWLSRITRRSPLQISISRPSRKRFARSVAWSSSSQRIGSKPTKCPSAPIVKARYSAIPKSPDAYWTIAGRENNSVRERTQFQIWSYSCSRTRLTAKRVDDLLKSSAGSAAPPEAFCCGGRNSLCNQPVTVSDLSGSGRSQSKHWNARRPLPPGGSARDEALLLSSLQLACGHAACLACVIERHILHFLARVLPLHRSTAAGGSAMGSRQLGTVQRRLTRIVAATIILWLACLTPCALRLAGAGALILGIGLCSRPTWQEAAHPGRPFRRRGSLGLLAVTGRPQRGEVWLWVSGQLTVSRGFASPDGHLRRARGQV